MKDPTNFIIKKRVKSSEEGYIQESNVDSIVDPISLHDEVAPDKKFIIKKYNKKVFKPELPENNEPEISLETTTAENGENKMVITPNNILISPERKKIVLGLVSYSKDVAKTFARDAAERALINDNKDLKNVKGIRKV